jgi:hypothetical protein
MARPPPAPQPDGLMLLDQPSEKSCAKVPSAGDLGRAEPSRLSKLVHER